MGLLKTHEVLAICDEFECDHVTVESRMQCVHDIVADRRPKALILYYCVNHRKPYDMHTTTSGYDRYYRGGQELMIVYHDVVHGKERFLPQGKFVEVNKPLRRFHS